MMKVSRNWSQTIFLVGIVFMATVRSATADFTVTIKDDGSTIDTLSLTSGTHDISKTYANFDLQFTAVSSNSPGTNVGALKFSSFEVGNVGNSGTRTLTVDIADSTFTSPEAPVIQ